MRLVVNRETSKLIEFDLKAKGVEGYYPFNVDLALKKTTTMIKVEGFWTECMNCVTMQTWTGPVCQLFVCSVPVVEYTLNVTHYDEPKGVICRYAQNQQCTIQCTVYIVHCTMQSTL